MSAEAAVVMTGKLPRKKNTSPGARKTHKSESLVLLHFSLPRAAKRLLNLAAAANDIKRADVLVALCTQIGDDGKFQFPWNQTELQHRMQACALSVTREVRRRLNLAGAANDLKRTGVIVALCTQIAEDGQFRFAWRGGL